MRIWQLSLYGIAAAGISTAAAADIRPERRKQGAVFRAATCRTYLARPSILPFTERKILCPAENRKTARFILTVGRWLKPAEFQLKHRYLTMRYRRSAEGPSRR